MKRLTSYYGGVSYGFGFKWLWFWLSDYTDNTVLADHNYSLQILWGKGLKRTKIFKN